MLPIAKDRLERICLAYLNHLERQRPVEALTLRRPSIGAVNWTLASHQPEALHSGCRRHTCRHTGTAADIPHGHGNHAMIRAMMFSFLLGVVFSQQVRDFEQNEMSALREQMQTILPPDPFEQIASVLK